MAKAAKAVKWALGADEPDDLADFLTNDDIVKKNKKRKEIIWPTKGPHTFKVKRLKVKDNKNGDPRISVMLIMDNGKKHDGASWNGYCIFDGFNVTEQGAPFIKRFLKALGLEWSDFMKKTKQVEDKDSAEIVQIGKVKFGADAAKDPVVLAMVKVKPADDYNDDEHMEITRYLPVDDDEDDDDEDVDDVDDEDVDDDEDSEDEDDDEEDDESDEDDEEDEEDEDDDEDEDEDEEDDDDEEEEDDDEEEELRAELKPLTVANLKKRAVRVTKRLKGDPDDIPAKKSDIIDYIVQCELGEPPF